MNCTLSDLVSNDINDISYEKLTVENATGGQVNVMPSEIEKEELIKEFLASAGPSSHAQALEYLTFYDWDVDQALSNHGFEDLHPSNFESCSDHD